ncbi:hypothetical protein C8J56DRAFT_900034 [Mycena floridula]|nr:hypothetical protein C8J56DRAFT_900034 [Mycena floridula]
MDDASLALSVFLVLTMLAAMARKKNPSCSQQKNLPEYVDDDTGTMGIRQEKAQIKDSLAAVSIDPYLIMILTIHFKRANTQREWLGEQQAQALLYGRQLIPAMSDTSQSGPLADTDIYSLRVFLVTTSIEFLLHGIYTTLVVIALYSLWYSSAYIGLRTKARLAARNVLILATIIMFSCSTTNTALDLFSEVVELGQLGYSPPEMNTVGLGVSGAVLDRINASLYFNMYLISDCIVVWRAWVLWDNHKSVRLLLMFCISASFVIGYKVCRRTQVEEVLILLTESGVIYCLVWVGMLSIGAQTGDQSLGYNIIAELVPKFSAVYPIIIILLVAWEKTNLETITAPAFSRSIQFASRAHTAGTGTQSDVDPQSTHAHTISVHMGPGEECRAMDPRRCDTLNAALTLGASISQWEAGQDKLKCKGEEPKFCKISSRHFNSRFPFWAMLSLWSEFLNFISHFLSDSQICYEQEYGPLSSRLLHTHHSGAGREFDYSSSPDSPPPTPLLICTWETSQGAEVRGDPRRYGAEGEW